VAPTAPPAVVMLSRQGIGATASEETTVRHALVPIHLIQDARAAGAPLVERAPVDAPPDPPATSGRRPRRLASLAHRALALVIRTT
jgi:hypothetical protein